MLLRRAVWPRSYLGRANKSGGLRLSPAQRCPFPLVSLLAVSSWPSAHSPVFSSICPVNCCQARSRSLHMFPSSFLFVLSLCLVSDYPPAPRPPIALIGRSAWPAGGCLKNILDGLARRAPAVCAQGAKSPSPPSRAPGPPCPGEGLPGPRGTAWTPLSLPPSGTKLPSQPLRWPLTRKGRFLVRAP